jgi:zinc protease
MRIAIGFLTGALLASASPALGQQQMPPAPGTPRDFTLPPARVVTLPNGLGVSFVQYGSVPKATVALVVQTGSADEGANQVWLSALTGDLLTEGTTTRTAEQIAREAASMGGSVFVSAGANQTTVGGEVLSEFSGDIAALIADLARNPAFPSASLERRKTDRIRNLSIARSQPQALAQERFRAVLYPNHPFGRLYPTTEMLQGYTVDDVRSFHGRNFGAARAHLYVVGRFDEAATEAAVRGAFSDWAPGTPAAHSGPSANSRREVHLVERPGAVQSTIYMGLPVIDPSHPDYVALQVTNALLGGSFASRITANIREQKGYTYSPFSTISARYRDAFWAEVADVTTNVTGAALTEIFGEIARLQAEPPSQDELRGIQNYMAGTFVLQNSSRNGIINQLAQVELHGLGPQHLDTFVRRVYAVTPAEVQRITRTYLDADRMAIVIVGDREAVLPQIEPFGTVTIEN